jgi:hypothetical protein
MLRSEHRLDHKAEVNCGPLSLVMIPGTPNLWIQPWRRAAAQSAAVMEVSGNASGQRVVLSMIVKRYEYPEERGSGPTIST